MDKFQFTDAGAKEAEAYLDSIGLGREYFGQDAVHYANNRYAFLNKQLYTSMSLDEIHGIKPKQNES